MGRSRDLEIDRAGLAGLLVSSGMQAAMTAAGQDVAQAASFSAPSRTGSLAGSYRVEPTTVRVRTKRGGPLPRASGRVVNDDPYAAAVEFGHLAGPVRGHAGFRWVVPGAHTLGRLAATKASKAARAAAARSRRRK